MWEDDRDRAILYIFIRIYSILWTTHVKISNIYYLHTHIENTNNKIIRVSSNVN